MFFMQSNVNTPDQYLESLPADRKDAIAKLREILKRSLPPGYKETMGYGMLAYVVPKSIYPAGYHANPALPLPFINLASQKNFIAIYHMGLYADKQLLNWFKEEYAKLMPTKLDMGKSCIRFKNMSNIPYDLITELVTKMKVEDWIDLYEQGIRSKA
ncbi:MAG: hypothetical protein ACJAT1_000967 [Marivirga sp.]|jgi:uncharacterized protein YdhG (YjbR/CyaY superfamily)